MPTPAKDLTLQLDQDEIENGEHDIEFEIPPSILSPNYVPLSAKGSSRPFSIDLSLELERQLEFESAPNTPAHPNTAIPINNKSPNFPSLLTPNPTPRPLPNSAGLPAEGDTMDPAILAHLIMQLRHSLADMTKERDDLLGLVAAAHSKEAELKDALQLMTDKATGMEDELHESRRKAKDDEEAISMLRTKVEESRRGLMRLQAENRRQSTVLPSALDLSRAGIPSFGTGPTSSKRASFTPLTGTMAGRSPHQRRSSEIDGSFNMTSPHSVTLALPDSAGASVATASEKMSRRISGIFGRTSPSNLDTMSLPGDNDSETLRREVAKLKDTVEQLQHELSEAKEAREAADVCVHALRDFIAENNLGQGGSGGGGEVKLPPLPTDTTGDEEDTKTKPAPATASGWGGFKLWKVDTTVKSAPGPTSAASISSMGHSINAATPTISSAHPPTTAEQPHFAKKLGSFFSSRTNSISSSSAHSMSKRDSAQSHSASDTSSLVEPLSPTGTNDHTADDLIRVRDSNSNSSEMGSLNTSPTEGKKL